MSEPEILDVPNASKIDGAIKEIESFDFIECNREINWSVKGPTHDQSWKKEKQKTKTKCKE